MNGPPIEEEETQDVGDESPATSTSTTNTTNEDGNNDTNGDTDPRMVLTPVEKEWALEIKAAALLEGELDRMTDFMYAQFAIHSLQTKADYDDDINLETVLQSIENYQLYMKEHRIRDTYQDGCRTLERNLRDLLPNHYLSFSYHESEDAYVLALDTTSFDRRVTNDPVKHSVHIAGTHYCFHAQQPDFNAMRKGVVTLFETKDYNWRDPDMFNVKCLKTIAEQSFVTPVRPRSLRYYNTGYFVGVVTSLAKRIFRKTVMSAVEVGWKYEDEDGNISTLRDVLVTPDQATTNERNLARLKTILKKRYDNQEAFRLS